MGISGFLDWYERHMAKSLIISAVILYMQIPHSWWALECIWGEGILHGHGVVVDFFLLLEHYLIIMKLILTF